MNVGSDIDVIWLTRITKIEDLFISICFFFQAEDGIRDLVRSRGLGDVYKRQGIYSFETIFDEAGNYEISTSYDKNPVTLTFNVSAVSYTHLTLPTSDLV